MGKKSLNNICTGMFFTVIALMFVGSSCNKGGKCFTNTGTVVQQKRPIQPFDSINLADNVNLILSKDSVPGITVEAGEKIISGITTDIVNRELRIGNLNTCNWLRSYEKPLNVYVSVDHLLKINYNSAGNISTSGVLDLDSLKVEVWGGCGTLDLNLKCSKGVFNMYAGTADFNFHGQCDIISIYTFGMGFCQARDLLTKYCYVDSKGTNDCYVNVSVSLFVFIENIGSVYYTGNPQSVGTKIQGSGVVEPFFP